MEEIGAKDLESPYTYYAIDPSWRNEYEAWVGSLTLDSFLEDVNCASFQFMSQLPLVVKAIDRRTARPALADFELDTYIIKSFYLYGVEGTPRFLMTRNSQGDLEELPTERLEYLDFGISLSNYLSYNELFTCLQESCGNCSPSYAMIVVLNMVAARMRLDAAQLSGEIGRLSIAEVALLAGMKEKSVRNLAHKEIGAFLSDINGTTVTVIPTDRAAAWLKGRRKYVPTQLPKSPAAQQALIRIARDYF